MAVVIKDWTTRLTELQKSNLYLIDKQFIGLTEEEKIERKKLMEIRKNEYEKKNLLSKKKQKIQELIDYTESLIANKNTGVLVKSKYYWKLGKELIKQGRKNRGLYYLDLSLQLKEIILGKNHPQIMNQLCYYNKVC
tara:strand:- start:17417 stop:17827 length:411 start_codon:yes stop_codon:yes gene_type:complete